MGNIIAKPKKMDIVIDVLVHVFVIMDTKVVPVASVYLVIFYLALFVTRKSHAQVIVLGLGNVIIWQVFVSVMNIEKVWIAQKNYVRNIMNIVHIAMTSMDVSHVYKDIT